MNRTMCQVVVGLLATFFVVQAHAQIDGCALALGRDASGNLTTELAYGKPNQYVAAQEVTQGLLRRGVQYIGSDSTANGAVALVVYQHVAGQMMYKFRQDTNALGAISGVLDDVGGVQSRAYPPFVRWVRCAYSPPLMQQQLAELTWSSSLTRTYSGYQVKVLEFLGNSGSLQMVPGGGSPPPTPTPAPQAWGTGGPVGCWQRYDYANRGDGNAIFIWAAGVINEGLKKYEGKHLALSAAQAAGGRQVGGFAIDMHEIANSPGSYFGGYEPFLGGVQVTGFTVSANEIATTMQSSAEKFTWRRVNSPAR